MPSNLRLPSALLALALGAAAAPALLRAPAPSQAGAEPRAPAAAVPARPDPWRAPAEPTRWATRYARFESFTTAHGLPSDRVTCVLAEGDRLAVGTEAGLALGRPGAFQRFGPEQGLPHAYVTALVRAPRGGDLWIGTLGGLARLSDGELTAFTQLDSGLANDVVYHLAAEGSLVWAATASGTSVFDASTGAWSVWDQRNSILHEPWCYALALGPGRTWIGVWGGGIVERDGADGRWREYRDPDGEMELDLLADDGPIHDVTSFLAYDEGLLWQTTYFGLSRFDGRAWRTWVARDSGLPGDFLTHVAARGRHAWVTTDQGFAVFDGTTCLSYRRAPDGGALCEEWRDGRRVGATPLLTAPADDYLLGCQPTPDGVWLATGRGLSHAIAADGADARPGAGDGR